MIYYVAIWCFLALTLSITADEGLGLGGLGGLGGSGDWSGLGGLVYAPKHASADYYAYPRYAFEYAVKDPHTGDNKAQWEKRDGDVVKGAYSLVEPDGSLRIVEYWADDKSGFNAVVKRVGPSLHPATVSAAPIYKAPIPVISSATIASPLSIGPVANLGGLASAPLITGSLGQGGISYSSASLIKAPPMAVAAAPIAPIAPVYSAPIVKSAPLEVPIGPMLPAPVYSPILKSPILQPDPILKNPQIWSSLGAGPIYSGGAPLIKGIPDYGFGDGLMKGGLGGYDIGLGLDKGAMLPQLLGSWGLPLGLKH